MREAFAFGRPWVAWVVLAMAALLGLPAVSFAQGKSAEQQLESIRRRMETGLSLFVGGKPTEAAAEFDAGYAEHPYSAFLFNAGVCYQKLGERDKALERYHEYLRIDPAAPDVDTVQKRIAALEAEKAQEAAAPPQPSSPDGGVPAAATPPTAPPASAQQIQENEENLRSLVVVETEPPGAPLTVYGAPDDAPPFQSGAANAAWKKVATAVSPSSLSLAVGRYHVVVEKFRDFNVSETDIKVTAGHVLQFKANLSQGVFMSFLRVSANVAGAHVWLDDEKKTRPEWGTTPYGELVASTDHDVRVEIPGFQPLLTKIHLEHGEQKELEVRLARVEYGILRVDGDGPDAKVRIDEEPKGIWRSGEAPLDVTAPSGKHRLRIDGTGRKTLDTMVDVPRGQVLPLHAKLIPKVPRGGAWTQAIIGGVFVGAGIFFGVESNKLYDQAKADRGLGVLDSDDNRITKGRIYSIAADCGFIVGGGLGALSVYSFLRDPLPESSVKADKPLEFDDPLKARPVSLDATKGASRVATRPRDVEATPRRFVAGPGVVGGGAGFAIGGTF